MWTTLSPQLRHAHHILRFVCPCQHGLCHTELLGDWYWKCLLWSTMYNKKTSISSGIRTRNISLLCIIVSFYAPNFENSWGHIAFGLSVCSSHFLMHAISYEPCILGFWNFMYGFLMEKYLTIFFLVRVISLSGVVPPLKQSQWNLVSKYLGKYLS